MAEGDRLPTDGLSSGVVGRSKRSCPSAMRQCRSFPCPYAAPNYRPSASRPLAMVAPTGMTSAERLPSAHFWAGGHRRLRCRPPQDWRHFQRRTDPGARHPDPNENREASAVRVAIGRPSQPARWAATALWRFGRPRLSLPRRSFRSPPGPS